MVVDGMALRNQGLGLLSVTDTQSLLLCDAASSGRALRFATEPLAYA